MVCVSRIQTVEEADAHISDIVSVGIFQKQDIWYTGDNDTPIPEFKTGGVVYLGKSDGLIGYTVTVFIGEDQEPVIHFL